MAASIDDVLKDVPADEGPFRKEIQEAIRKFDMDKKCLWEIFVPKNHNEKTIYGVSHHREWNRKVTTETDVILLSSTPYKKKSCPTIGKCFFSEEMILLRVCCTSEEFDKILDITIDHYDRDEIIAFKISDKMIVKKKVTT